MAANAVLSRLPRSKGLWLTKALLAGSTCRCGWLLRQGPGLSRRAVGTWSASDPREWRSFRTKLAGLFAAPESGSPPGPSNRFGLVDDILEDGLGLRLPAACILHQVLGGGKIGLNIRNRLLTGLRRQVCRDALVER